MPFNCSTNSYVHSPLILPAPPILVTKKFDPCSLHQNSATPTSHPNWKWRTFKNSARSDDLELSHWSISNPSVSFTQPNDSPYPFSVFNQKVDVLQYSYDEWEQAKRYYPLEWESWSKEETDYLFQMCQQWDLRFQLIADRWAPPVLDAPSRDMEDLKEHYLYMTQAILQVRFPSLDTYQQQVVARLLQYDKKKEKERKNHLLVLWERTQKEVQEEIDLHRTLLEFEDSHLQLMKDRQELLSRFYKGLDPYEITSHVTKRKKIKENQWTASTQIPKPIQGVVFSSEKKTPGVFLRSIKLTNFKSTLHNKLNGTLQELGIVRPLIITYEIAQRYEELRSSVLTLLEYKKKLENAEAELKPSTLKQVWASGDRKSHSEKEKKIKKK